MKAHQSQLIQTMDGAPIDYSFKSLHSLTQLLLSIQVVLQPSSKQQQSKQQKKKQVQQTNQLQQSNENKQGNNPYETKLEIVRTIEISEAKILDLNKNASKKKQKNQKKVMKIIKSNPSALFLRYNKIMSLDGLYTVTEKIFPNLNNLIWIDLSFNRLVQLNNDFSMFPNLKNIYLHSNFIFDFKQIDKLKSVKNLRSMTIYANPLEKYQQFRVLISNIIPQLHKIDSTLLTKRQRDRGQVIGKTMKKYPVIKNPQKRPDQSDAEQDN